MRQVSSLFENSKNTNFKDSNISVNHSSSWPHEMANENPISNNYKVGSIEMNILFHQTSDFQTDTENEIPKRYSEDVEIGKYEIGWADRRDEGQPDRKDEEKNEEEDGQSHLDFEDSEIDKSSGSSVSSDGSSWDSEEEDVPVVETVSNYLKNVVGCKSQQVYEFIERHKSSTFFTTPNLPSLFPLGLSTAAKRAINGFATCCGGRKDVQLTVVSFLFWFFSFGSSFSFPM